MSELEKPVFSQSNFQHQFYLVSPRFTRNVINKHEPPTIGVDYSAKSIVLRDGTIVKAKIWDTGLFYLSNILIFLAGSEKYKAITTAYLNFRIFLTNKGIIGNQLEQCSFMI